MRYLLSLTAILLSLCHIVEAKVIHVPSDQATIQGGIDMATDGDTVLVNPDVYVENISFKGKGIVVGSLFLTTLDTSYISQTIIDGDSTGRVVLFTPDEGKTSVLCGFTIQNGLGGILCSQSSPKITNCTISNNSTNNTEENEKGAGGGIYCYQSSPTISQCTIYGNTALGHFAMGGGICCDIGSHPEITHCIISNNFAVSSANWATSGGGIYSAIAGPAVYNCLIIKNQSSIGAGILCHTSTMRMVNSTVTENINGSSGSTVNVTGDGTSSIDIINCIIYGNTGKYDVAVSDLLSTISCSYSDIGSGYSGGSNIDDNPLFIGGGDYSLQAESPCIDVGHSWYVSWNRDLNGNQRLWDSKGYGIAIVDMGAYECGSQIVSPLYLTHNTGDFKMSVFQDGCFGHLSALGSIGEGCQYKSYEDVLFSSGLIFGTTSAGYVNGNQASFGIINDFTNIDPIHSITSMDPEMNYISEAAYNDQGTKNPYGVAVSQKAYSNSGDEFVILEFGFTPASNTLNDFYAGIFADWDIGGDEGAYKNLGGYDEARNLAYQYIPDMSPDPAYYGIVALSGMAGAKVTPDSVYDSMRETSFQRISTFENETIADTGDCRMWIGSGPFTLIQDDTIFVYFSFVAGTDLADLQSNTDAAVEKYQHRITGVEEYEIQPEQFHLSQNYPNPFNRTTLIEFQIPQESRVTLEIFDNLGRKVKTLMDEHKNAGNYKVAFNSRNLSSGIYFYRITAGEFSVTKRMALQK